MGEIRQGYLRVSERGQHGVQAEDPLPEQTASRPRLSTRRGPGHSLEGLPGFPGIGLTLQDRRAPAIKGGDWSVTTHPSPWRVLKGPLGEAHSLVRAEELEAAKEGKVSPQRT